MFKFSNFNIIDYDNKKITDFTTKFQYNKSMLNNIYYFVPYNIKDGDTPNSLCTKLYDDETLDWILLEVNNIIDPYFDWPLTTDELLDFCKTKYGESSVYNVNHYELNGIVVNSTVVSSEPITNYDYEAIKNDKKRNILLPTPEFMNEFVFAYGAL